MNELLTELSVVSGIFLILALGLAFGFEFVNGFHDTANAVATVIYTNTLKPNYAVIWSGLWNLIGVLTSSGTVAFGIIALLPVELVIDAGSGRGFAMVLGLLIAAIIWNLGTWYLGLPASSSHTLIGTILGVGVANAIANGETWGAGVNWNQVLEVFKSLLISPLLGFVAAALLLLGAKALIKNPDLYSSPTGETPPPWWIRGLLIFTCTGVSFAHGSNDGQKGMGLIMLILIGILPGLYALDLNVDAIAWHQLSESSQAAIVILDRQASGSLTSKNIDLELSQFLKSGHTDSVTSALALKNQAIAKQLQTSVKDLSPNQCQALRRDIYLITKAIALLVSSPEHKLTPQFTNADQEVLRTYSQQLTSVIEFIPIWVKVAVAIALGLGTTVGWKRIVVTVGEKIGKEHLTYAQGAAAELVAMAAIGGADYLGLPVSTTHVLSSGIAGAMTANGSGIQKETVRNLVLAWVLTLPICMFLGGITFLVGLLILDFWSKLIVF